MSEEVLEDSELGAQAEQTRRALSPGGDGTLRGPCGVRLYSRSEREFAAVRCSVSASFHTGSSLPDAPSSCGPLKIQALRSFEVSLLFLLWKLQERISNRLEIDKISK